MSFPAPGPPARPTPADVAALLRARTKDSAGTELGTFTVNTRPTDVQVQQLIVLAEGDVLIQVGDELGPVTAAEATSMIALRAACMVEVSYWPEQIRTNRSAYDELWRMYEAGMENLKELIAAGGGGEDGGGAEGLTKGYGSVPVRSWTMLDEYQFDEPVVAAPLTVSGAAVIDEMRALLAEARELVVETEAPE